MSSEKIDEKKTNAIIKEIELDTAKFISTEEDEQEGNFEFLCCRGGGSTGPSNPGHGW